MSSLSLSLQELVMDKDEKGDLHPRYLIYDIIKFEVSANFVINRTNSSRFLRYLHNF